MSIPVFVPAFSRVLFPPSDKTNSVGKLLRAIWDLEDENMNLPLREKGVKFSQLSLRSLVSDLQKCYNSDLTSLTAHSLNQFS
jgi:hypothetical protein